MPSLRGRRKWNIINITGTMCQLEAAATSAQKGLFRHSLFGKCIQTSTRRCLLWRRPLQGVLSWTNMAISTLRRHGPRMSDHRPRHQADMQKSNLHMNEFLLDKLLTGQPRPSWNLMRRSGTAREWPRHYLHSHVFFLPGARMIQTTPPTEGLTITKRCLFLAAPLHTCLTMPRHGMRVISRKFPTRESLSPECRAYVPSAPGTNWHRSTLLECRACIRSSKGW